MTGHADLALQGIHGEAAVFLHPRQAFGKASCSTRSVR